MVSGTIDIKNLRNITRLRFEVPDRGVWLLTAANGCGKTSLLGCLHRIGHSNAFGVHFPSSLQSNQLDNHAKGSISYEINGETVEYAYRGERWTPRPRKNSRLLEKFGYSSVLYIGVTAERITPRPEDFNTHNLRRAEADVVDAANYIFETKKFSSLRTINLSRGVGNDAFVLSLGGAPATYHSEKHFSLGELCILKLLRLLKDAGNNSMIIIDELEMALHPRAQVNLLKHLEKISKDKSLTIIFSTHSATLLKTINKKNIIYLDRQESGEVVPVVGCFPTYAIGSIAADEESLPDIVLYVEDIFAREVLQAFYEKFAEEKFKDPTTRPTIKIVPIGPFDAVVAFLDRNHAVLPSQVLQRAILDYDVKDESIKILQKSMNYVKLAKMEKNSKDISYLPFTPEVGLADYIVDNTTAFENAIRVRCRDNQIRISPLISDYNCTVSGADRRRSAKVFVDKLEKYLSIRLQKESDSVVEHLCGVFANIAWSTYRREFMELFGSVCR